MSIFDIFKRKKKVDASSSNAESTTKTIGSKESEDLAKLGELNKKIFESGKGLEDGKGNKHIREKSSAQGDLERERLIIAARLKNPFRGV